MERSYVQMLQSFQQKLSDKLASEPDPIKAATDNIQIANATITELHAYLDAHPFDDLSMEIWFFKELRPQIDGLRFYYMQRLQLELRTKFLVGSEKVQVYRRHQQRIATFFESNAAFYRYHILGHTYLDQLYFSRQPQSGAITLEDQTPLMLDPRYYAPMSYQAARLHAFELLGDHLDQQLIRGKAGMTGPVPATELLQWTAPKAALGELLYALQEYGVFNNTKVEVKKIADYFEKVFDVDLKNIYKMYEDFRLRKKSRTPFLDALRNCVLRRMDLDDEHSL